MKEQILSGLEKSLFLAAKTLEIVLGLFWRRDKACPSRFGKSLFELKKAIPFRFGNIAFSGRQDARNCVNVVLTPCKSVAFQIRENRLFRWKTYFFQVWKNVFQVAKTLELCQGCSGALKKRYLSGSENRLLCWKTITFRSLKISFSVHQDARNCVKVVLAPWKGVPFPIRKIAFSAEKAFSFTFGKITFQVAKTLEIASRLFWRPQKAFLLGSKKIALLAVKAISLRF